MHRHFNISKNSLDAIKAKGFSDSDIIKLIPAFDPIKSNLPLTTVSLYYYADNNPDFASRQNGLGDLLACAMLDALPIEEKMKVLEYQSS